MKPWEREFLDVLLRAVRRGDTVLVCMPHQHPTRRPPNVTHDTPK